MINSSTLKGQCLGYPIYTSISGGLECNTVGSGELCFVEGASLQQQEDCNGYIIRFSYPGTILQVVPTFSQGGDWVGPANTGVGQDFLDFIPEENVVDGDFTGCFQFSYNSAFPSTITIRIIDPNDPSSPVSTQTVTIGTLPTAIGVAGETKQISEYIGNELLPTMDALSSGQEIRIRGTLEINESYTFGFDPNGGVTNKIIMDAGAKIVVKNGYTLGFLKADISACNSTWNGILVESNANLHMNETWLYDATTAVEMQDGASFDMLLSNFIDNGIGIGVFGPNPKNITINFQSNPFVRLASIVDGQTGIHLENVVNFDQSAIGYKLSLNNLTTGIHLDNSNASLANFYFENCETGINEVSGNDFITCDYCSIARCDYGVKTIGTSVFTVMNSYFRENTYDIHKRTQAANEITLIDENEFFAYSTYDASGINIFAQTFPSDLASSVSLNKSFTALNYNVHLSGLGKGNHNWIIQDNDIMGKLGAGLKGANVYFLDIGNSSILENGDVSSMSQNFVINGGGNNSIVENIAEGSITNVTLNGSKLSSVECNILSRTTLTGSVFPSVTPSNIYIENDCSTSDIRGNSMNQTNFDGLGRYNLAYGNAFNTYANTRRQEFKGNVFNFSQEGSPKAKNYGPSFLAAQNVYLVADENSQGNEYYPYFDANINDWFRQSNLGDDYICETDSNGFVSMEPTDEVLLKAVENGLAIQDAGLANYYGEEIAFDSRLKLYRHLVLLDEIEALPSTYDTLFDTLSSADIALFVAFERAYLNAVKASPEMVAKHDTITTLQAEIREIKWLVQDTTGQEYIIDAQQAVYDAKMGRLKQLTREHGTLLNAQQVQIDNLLPSLNYINESAANQTTQSGQNQYEINKLLLERYHSGFTGYDTSELQTLIAIADQCPVEGGEAVHTARALRADVEGMPQEYDDQCVSGLSNRENQEQSQMATTWSHSMVVSPNPASTDLSIYLPEGFTDTEIFVADMYGRVLRIITVDSNRRLTLETHDWPNGIYFLSGGNGLQTKFIIAH